MSEDKKIFPATRVVHWPSGPVNCCDEHARQLMKLNEVMSGGHIVHTRPEEGATCSNCENEDKS